MKNKKLVALVLGLLILTVSFGSVVAYFLVQRQFSNTAVIILSRDFNIYTTMEATEEVTSLDWETLNPEDVTIKSVYAKMTGQADSLFLNWSSSTLPSWATVTVRFLMTGGMQVWTEGTEFMELTKAGYTGHQGCHDIEITLTIAPDAPEESLSFDLMFGGYSEIPT